MQTSYSGFSGGKKKEMGKSEDVRNMFPENEHFLLNCYFWKTCNSRSEVHDSPWFITTIGARISVAGRLASHHTTGPNFTIIFTTAVKGIMRWLSESSFANWLCLSQANWDISNHNHMDTRHFNCYKCEPVAKHLNCDHVTARVVQWL